MTIQKEKVSERIPLRVAFKGERDYLQGGDIYNAIVDEVTRRFPQALTCEFRLAFHCFFHRACDMVVVEGIRPEMKPENAAVEFYFVKGQEGFSLSGWLLESNREVEERNPFDEDRIQGLCRTEGNKKIIRGDSGYTSIEAAVSMTKYLHMEGIPDASGKWIFTKLDIKRLIKKDDGLSLEIELKHNFGNRLTRSQITKDGEIIGDIYFTLVQK